ncbi:MAG: acetyl-CoA carboxylase carboxyltransferase subunit beta [Pelotomaculum sp.]|uniref:Acetyl-coenzyme A carboxylase carboxyl transferase subunit beta n=1 Tax=Pelotomaculum thermopropionicum (strain DSM 13744 / JCM 10971 / SI) TaxID=370438 RepID=ACCD_PELTS|nr:RecName: Full=Acetyl-coenzyme A carboxylase carboxyl transferase subunit beta; Short=ACCase subunit beta; Short=Acetyl-CoA carboxylase carboxyltransferase subunit beta [Pelotomaculum thermopropionicum SI]NPV72601.1 acetyl-CoA carboxylase carboxyltransferase subunit beta [Pelotomaculum sp.]BAF60398.1 acetyl-CoA carboxylase beta subunit [Pelotomaculum thermopropionicum SI]
MILDLFRKQKYITVQPESETREIPEGVWVKCERCGEILFKKELDKNYKVCLKCGFHFRLSAFERIAMTVDEGSFKELDAALLPVNPFNLPDYESKLVSARQSTGLNEAVLTGEAAIEGYPAVVVVMDARFMMASMGTVVGEKITRAAEAAAAGRRPLIIFSASGGARMQEGILSLMQMAKTVAALARLGEEGQLYISVLTDPTTGGVSASFAALGDIVIAEPGALIGFAGPRVIEQTIRQKLPEGFQRAEFLKQHGFVDMIVPRPQMKETLARLLDLHLRGEK